MKLVKILLKSIGLAKKKISLTTIILLTFRIFNVVRLSVLNDAGLSKWVQVSSFCLDGQHTHAR